MSEFVVQAGSEPAGAGRAPDLQVVFLGTGSMQPTRARLCQGVGLITAEHGTMLVDAGEGVQINANLLPEIPRKIFITHLHGDHVYGLPGLLCRIRGARGAAKLPFVEIYGPRGLAAYLHSALSFSGIRAACPWVVHELMGVPPLMPEAKDYLDRTAKMVEEATVRFEATLPRAVGKKIYPNPTDGTYLLCDPAEEDGLKVTAAPLEHTIPSVGYVVETKSSAGTLNAARVNQAVRENEDTLRHQIGLPDPRTLLRSAKHLAPGDALHFPDGQAFSHQDLCGDEQPSMKVVVLGDTADSSMIRRLSHGAHVLVHEATLSQTSLTPTAYRAAPEMATAVTHAADRDGATSRATEHGSGAEPRVETVEEFDASVRDAGHSSARMAGRFAAAIEAQHVLLTHFSSRYAPGSPAMEQIGHIAQTQAPNAHSVHTAYDGFTFKMYRAQGRGSSEGREQILAERQLRRKGRKDRRAAYRRQREAERRREGE